MAGIKLPRRVEKEFESVRILTESTARTRRIDALLLAWIKYEKQLNRLLYFSIFTHSSINNENLRPVIKTLASVSYSWRKSVALIEKMIGVELSSLLTPDQKENRDKIEKISALRNKFMHGSYSGGSESKDTITSKEIRKHLDELVAWVNGLAEGAHEKVGYDGISTGLFDAAKNNPRNWKFHHPFSNLQECEDWIRRLDNKKKKRG